MKTTTLVPAFGSNRLNAERPAALLRGCEWIGVPFAGGMSECAHFTARTMVINDKHAQLMNLGNIIRHPDLGPMLIRDLRRLPVHPYELRHAQEHCIRVDLQGIEDGDPATKGLGLSYRDAMNYFVTAWMGRSGLALTDQEFKGGLALRWNAGGGDSAVRYRSAIDALRAWKKILARATFSVLDCFEFLDKCKDQPKHGIYCDPPWPSDGDAYKHKFSEKMHGQLETRLSEFKETRIVVRYGDHELIRELYKESRWTWRLLEGRTQANEAKQEVLLTNWKV